MAILFVSEGVKKPKLKFKDISFWIKQIILNNNLIAGNITYIFCNDEYLLDINKRFLTHDYFTDIITFDYCAGNMISGDMYISVDRVKENCEVFNDSYENEILRVVVHGLLHLLGYKDSSDTERELIREMENKCILMFQNIENGCFK